MPFVVQNIEGLLLLFCGGYCTYLAFRGVPAGTAKLAEWQQWYARWGTLLKIAGPIVMLTGAAKIVGNLVA